MDTIINFLTESYSLDDELLELTACQIQNINKIINGENNHIYADHICNTYAGIYYEENNTPIKAEIYYLMAIEDNFVYAMHKLAKLYNNQNRLELAEKYYLMAIKQNNIDSMYHIGKLYDKQNRLELAKKYYLMAIEKDHLCAKFYLGSLYQRQRKIKLAEKYYIKAANDGHSDAMVQLGLLYEKQGEIELAMMYYNTAINKENVEAIYSLGKLHEGMALSAMSDYETESEMDFELAEKYYLMAIERGHDKAINSLGNIYKIQGKIELAEKYYLMAINEENVEAMFSLGDLHGHVAWTIVCEYNTDNSDCETEIDMEFELAEKYYLMAIKRGHIDSMEKLGSIYRKQGKIELAEKYLLGAFEGGNKAAIFMLAILYDDQNNLQLAEKYYLIAIKNDPTHCSTFNLAHLYDRFENYELAEKYFLITIETNRIDCVNSLMKLYKKMNCTEKIEEFYLKRVSKGESKTMAKLEQIYKNQKIKFYKKLSELPKNHLISTKIKELKSLKEIKCYDNKINMLSKTDECPICLENKKLIPLECCHHFCIDCFVELKECAICKMKI